MLNLVEGEAYGNIPPIRMTTFKKTHPYVRGLLRHNEYKEKAFWGGNHRQIMKLVGGFSPTHSKNMFVKLDHVPK